MKVTDYERIKRIVADKAASWWKPYNDGMIDALVEDLASFDDRVLQTAMKNLRRTCKNQPRISQIIEACREQTACKESGRLGTYESIKNPRRPDENALRELLCAPIGKKAAAEGCMRDMWLEALDGKKDFSETDISRWKSSKAEGVRLMLEHPAKQSPWYKALEKLHYSMQEQSEELATKYAA